ncbi:MAG: NUDIX domain-containing protein [Promethearchaeota archaeon]
MNKKKVIDMGKNVSIECSWVPYFTGFSYTDEKQDFTTGSEPKPLTYNSLGYFKFNVEYYKDNNLTREKESIEPILIQQIPIIVLKILKEFCEKEEEGKKVNEHLLIDCESNIYDMVISNGSQPSEIPWNGNNIEKYKRSLGYWIEIYSGGWGDYSDELFNHRIEQNLSNRMSELHFLCRNSGFIFMEKENYENYFDYIERRVVEPTAEIRAMQYALISINDSLNILFNKQQGIFMSLKKLEEKINQLRLLKGTIQTKLSLIYNEVDWNRRQHYTRILTHLLKEFRLGDIIERVESKFALLEDSLNQLYLQRRETHKIIREKTLTLLNILFSLGIVADITGLIMAAFYLESDPILTFYVNALMLAVIVIFFIGALWNHRRKIKDLKEIEKGFAVDAIIEDKDGNIILIKRKFPPFKGMLALPGGFIEKEKGEKPKEAVKREVREETNLIVKVEKKIGKFDKEDRDPRDRIVSKVYKCSILEGKVESGDDAYGAKPYSKSKLKDLKLAFDHKQMLKKAGYEV